MMREIHIHIHRSNGLLFRTSLIKNRDGIGDGFHPDLLYIDPAVILLILDIFHNREYKMRG
jgi:hypothetical protein